jgi:hypothetical protein
MGCAVAQAVSCRPPIAVMEEVALGQDLLRVLRFSRQYNSTVALHNHISTGGMNKWPVGGCSSET